MTDKLINITTDKYDVTLFIVYATDKNVTGKQIYDKPLCFLHKEAATSMSRAIQIIKPLGLKFKIWDAYRPVRAQELLFQHTPNPIYISDPKIGIRPHCRGIAIDLTLTDKNGIELPMGTPFDDFTQLSHHGNKKISEDAQRNRLILAGAMSIAGFKTLDNEWWHYHLPNPLSYAVINETEIQTGIMNY